MRRTTLAIGVVLFCSLLLLGYSTLQAQNVLPDPGSLKQFGNVTPGSVFLFNVTGKTTGGSLWGTDYYTTDSSLAMAAVHAGAIRNGEAGVVKVIIYPGRSGYTASQRYGVTSASWGSYEVSFTVEPAEAAAATTAQPSNAVLPNPGAIKDVPGVTLGKVFLFEVTGAKSGGSVWGTAAYTTDSNLAMAAVHAGVLKPGETGVIKVTIVPGQKSYAGSTKNGVTSAGWGKYDLSFMMERSQTRKVVQAQPEMGSQAQGNQEEQARSVFVKLVNAAKAGKTEEFKSYLLPQDLKEMEAKGMLPFVMLMMAEDNPAEYTADNKGDRIEFKKETKSADGSESATVHMVKVGGQWKFGKPKE